MGEMVPASTLEHHWTLVQRAVRFSAIGAEFVPARGAPDAPVIRRVRVDAATLGRIFLRGAE